MKRIALLFLASFVPALLGVWGCEEVLGDKPIPCREGIYEKDRYPKVECKHAQHRLIDQGKHWLCKCAGAPPPTASASGSAAAPAASSAAEPAAAPEPPAKPAKDDDYSWLDTKY